MYTLQCRGWSDKHECQVPPSRHAAVLSMSSTQHLRLRLTVASVGLITRMEWAFRRKVWARLRKSVGGPDRPPNRPFNHELWDFPDHPTNESPGRSQDLPGLLSFLGNLESRSCQRDLADWSSVDVGSV